MLDLPLNATSLNITTNGNGPGDVNLYYGGSQRPTLRSINNRRWGSSQEQITRSLGNGTSLPSTSPYPAHIGVYGYSAGDYEVTASWNDMVFTQTLPNGNREFLLQNFPVYATQPLHFAIQVPNAPAYNSLNITALSGGDATLLVRRDVPPDKYNYDISLNTLSGSSVLINNTSTPGLASGTWWFALYSADSRSDMTELRAVLQP